MTLSPDHRQMLEELEDRLVTLLPAEYQGCYEDVQPVSMRSAGLKYGPDGKVAWNEMWATFCDLAMAGGPPHKGTLLEPATAVEMDAQFDRYREVVQEICRGIDMVTGLVARPSSTPGWVSVECHSEGMAGWLRRAVVMENVSARHEGCTLDVPAGPGYRLEKEIKNVVTVVAKTCHYWTGHMWGHQHQSIAELFEDMAGQSPLVEPGLARDSEAHPAAVDAVAQAISGDTGLGRSHHRYDGWLGLECPSVRSAVWMMRALVASNVLSRREGTVLFVPINPALDPGGGIVAHAVALIHRLAAAKGRGAAE